MQVSFMVVECGFKISAEMTVGIERLAEYSRKGRFSTGINSDLSRLMKKPTKWHVGPAMTQISLGIRPV